jgi:hypothetical protein
MFISEYIFKDINKLIDSASSTDDLLHKMHTNYEQPIFDYLRSQHLNYFRKWWHSYILPSNTENNIVIYETRCHPNLEFLIYNLTYFARNWGLIIYCSKANFNFINNILQHNKNNAVLNIIRDDEGGREVRNEYNEFVKSSKFWDSLNCKYILMCEMDTYLRKKVPNNILDYDYVCCKWPGTTIPGGGGISFRKVSSMQKICKTYPNLSAEIFAQDYWASEGCIKLNLSYNNTYLVESDRTIIDPIGLHNWWTFIHIVNTESYYYIYDSYLTLEL